MAKETTLVVAAVAAVVVVTVATAPGAPTMPLLPGERASSINSKSITLI